MLSVTQRIKMITQPRGGYVSVDLFKEESYEDMFVLQEIQSEDVSLSSIQGMAVDYLTRYVLTGDKVGAFHIPCLGAQILDEANENNDETKHLFSLLNDIQGLDNCSVEAACRAVGYDVAFRVGIKAYKNVDEIPLNPEILSNVRIMVNRSLAFFRLAGPLLSTEMTFEGGYTELVSKGDADFLTKEMLIDIKVSQQKMSSKWSLQLLMYYLLGLHSIHPEYQTVNKLCIFNPYQNKSYTVSLADISDKTKYIVSHDVLGYKMADPFVVFGDTRGVRYDYSSWNQVLGSDKRVVQEFFTQRVPQLIFDISDYQDGIHKISVNEYWACLGQVDKEYKGLLRPSFSRIDYVLMLKKGGYLMFLSVSHKGTLGVLNGGTYRNCPYTAEYYYENMEKYAAAIINRFSKYWDILYGVSRQLQKLKPSEKALRDLYSDYQRRCKTMQIQPYSYSEWYKSNGYMFNCTGRVHGCIVDIDYWNHIYINPYDGTLVPYYAVSMYDKDVYRNVKSLISHKRPELVESFDALARRQPQAFLVTGNNSPSRELDIKGTDIDTDIVKVYSYDMYAVSNRLKPLQKIYDVKVIQVWYDSALWNGHLIEESFKPKGKTLRVRSYQEQSAVQKNGRVATIIRYGGYKDIDVQFDDGTIVEKTTIQKWKNGSIKHPNDCRITKKALAEKTIVKKSTIIKDKYIGKVKKMRCGLNATIIDYQGYDKVTIRFEDGLVRKNVRSDHFNNGNIAHIADAE